MASWQYKISIKKIHDVYKENEHLPTLKTSMIAEVRKLADRVRLNHDKAVLEDIALGFEAVEDIVEYDEVLCDFYNWGDAGHKCWINSFT